MGRNKTITVVDCHAEGESGQVVVGGIPPIPEDTVFDKRMHLQDHADDSRPTATCQCAAATPSPLSPLSSRVGRCPLRDRRRRQSWYPAVTRRRRSGDWGRGRDPQCSQTRHLPSNTRCLRASAG
jgi:hypothetical protein